MILKTISTASPDKLLLIVILTIPERPTFLDRALRSYLTSKGKDLVDCVVLQDNDHSGPAMTLNSIMALMLNYKYVIVLDDDNMLLNLQLTYEFLQQDTDEACFYYSDIYYEENDLPKGIYKPREKMFLESAVLSFNLWGSKIYKVTCLSATGFFFPSDFGYDMMTCFKLLRNFEPAKKLPYPINVVTIHPNTLTNNPARPAVLARLTRIAKTWL